MAITKSSLANQVKDMLLERILKGEYQPGDRLVELAIAKELGVSQAPVREALQMLESLRIVESAPNRGTHVRHITEREMAESTVVRGILEASAARSAAPYLKEHHVKLQAEKDAMAAALAANDVDGVARHNVNFHRLIIEASGNDVLTDTWNGLHFEAKSRICAAKAGYAVLARGIDSHQAIIDAFAAGDGEKAGQLLREQTERCALEQDAHVSTTIISSRIANVEA